MDAPYYPSSTLLRKTGMLEVIAAASSEEHFRSINRCYFTRALSEQLRTRIERGPSKALSAAELHAKLLVLYPTLMLDTTDRGRLTDLPTPIHIQTSENSKLPSILLTPFRSPPPSFNQDINGQHMQMTFRINDEPIDVEAWLEWLRLMPDSIRHVKTDGPWRGR
jgi:hypothetical protein